MILYHFCCAKDVRGIRNKGIYKGMLPKDPEKAHFIAGWQWLTLDGEKARQSWNTNVLLSYDRTEYRWTVEIPEGMETQLYDRDRLAALAPGTEALFDGWEGSGSWRAYRGPIPKHWLKKLERWDAARGEWEAM